MRVWKTNVLVELSRFFKAKEAEMTIDFFYSNDCPHHEETFQALLRVLKRNGWAAGIHRIVVKDKTQAERNRYLGSPTVRANGHDLEEGADSRTDFTLGCREYTIDGKKTSVLPEDYIEKALKRIVAETEPEAAAARA